MFFIFTVGKLCAKDLQNLKNWTYRWTTQYEHKLSTQGKDDLRFLAKRLKAQFASVLDTPYTNARIAVSRTLLNICNKNINAALKNPE